MRVSHKQNNIFEYKEKMCFDLTKEVIIDRVLQVVETGPEKSKKPFVGSFKDGVLQLVMKNQNDLFTLYTSIDFKDNCIEIKNVLLVEAFIISFILIFVFGFTGVGLLTMTHFDFRSVKTAMSVVFGFIMVYCMTIVHIRSHGAFRCKDIRRAIEHPQNKGIN